ncbi:hypothetical protein [Roseovarius halotolerans]|uniref:hypothetical protein n=1 Tax=Roseovarius halotolerans TaxID=505353 RepID=UPI001592E51E|nr:hypothetical protein [Roseovarius halotolerans]
MERQITMILAPDDRMFVTAIRPQDDTIHIAPLKNTTKETENPFLNGHASRVDAR